MSGLNPWFVLVLGILIGWLLQWTLELWYFRRIRAKTELQLRQTQEELQARLSDLNAARTQLRVLRSDLNEKLAEIDALTQKVSSLESELASQEAELAQLAAEQPTEEPAAAAFLAGAAAPDLDIPTEEPAENALGEVEAMVQLTQAELAAEALTAATAPDKPRKAETGEFVETTPAGAALAPEEELPEGEVSEEAAERVKNSIATAAAGVAAAFEALTAKGKTQEEAGPPAKTETAATETEAVAAGKEAATPETEVVADDLTAISGIGPKFASILVAAGINTFADLAQATPEQLAPLADSLAWKTARFETWIEQAKAFSGQATAGQTEKRKRPSADKLTAIKGIGPVFASVLADAGITTFQDLANATPEQLAPLSDSPAWRRARFDRWIEQAKMLSGEIEAAEDIGPPDDLSLIEGMEPVFASVLADAGITTFEELANADVEKLSSLAWKASKRKAEFESWIEQAKRLAKESR